jgi:hypothetical protein
MKTIDLRSDTVTRPTPAMREAIDPLLAEAEAIFISMNLPSLREAARTA